MGRCEENSFCAYLPEELRARLCRQCVLSSFAKDTVTSIDENHAWIVIEGIACCTVKGKPTTLLFPGDLVTNPNLGPDSNGQDHAQMHPKSWILHQTRYTCVTQLTFASIPNSLVSELMDDAAFCKVLYHTTLRVMSNSQQYSAALYQTSATESVRSVLRLARMRGMGPLTHDQLSRLTGRNRVTVTRAMHEIALSEPELVCED